jgi:hypothetical protein
MSPNSIGILKESTLHADLKKWYSLPTDRQEVPVDGFVIDIVRENLLIEIQTGNFSSLIPKLQVLLNSYQLRLIYPIAIQKQIVMLDSNKETIIRRRLSTKRGRVEDLFWEMLYIARYVLSENFSFEILFIHEEEYRYPAHRRRNWRKYWTVLDRKLISVLGSQTFRCGNDYLELLTLDQPCYSNNEIAEQLNLPIKLTRRMTYTLREMQVLEVVGKNGNTLLFSKKQA